MGDTQERAAREVGGRRRPWSLSGETVWLLVLLLVAIGLFWVTSSIDVRRAHDPLGARFFPRYSSLLLATAALAMLVRRGVAAWSRRRSVSSGAHGTTRTVGARSPGRPRIGSNDRRVMAMIVIAVAYVAALELVTYIPATIGAMLGVQVVLGAKLRPVTLIAAIATTTIVYLVFTTLLSVRLP